MRRLFGWFVALGVCLAAVMATSAQFKMADGAVIEGELVAPNDEGTVIRRASGGLTGRIPWDRFAQETLQEFTNNPALAGFVEAYIDYPEPPEEERVEIPVHDPPGLLERSPKRPRFWAAYGTPAGWFILLVLFAANLYAAYEVAIYRNYPPAAVIGTSVILPILGPILFLCMPTREVRTEPEYEAPPEPELTPAQEAAAAELAAGSGLALGTAGKKSSGSAVQAVTYKAGDVEFNRSFFERTFPQFFRLTRSDGESVLSVRSAKGEVVATRISRISSNEIGLMTQKGQEVQVRFGDISEVSLKPKA